MMIHVTNPTPEHEPLRDEWWPADSCGGAPYSVMHGGSVLLIAASEVGEVLPYADMTTLTVILAKRTAANRRRNENRRTRDQVRRDLGLVKVRGALGGTYWE